MSIKDTYLELLKNINISSISFLEDIGFFDAPASTKYHDCYDGGLAVHSLKTYKLMNEINRDLNLNIDQRSIIKLGLFHDLAKSGRYEHYAKNEKVYCDTGSKYDDIGRFNWVTSLGYRIKDNSERDCVGSTGFESYILCKDMGISFTKEEIIALCNYDYIQEENNNINISSIMGQNKLIILLHVADTLSTYCFVGENDLSL